MSRRGTDAIDSTILRDYSLLITLVHSLLLLLLLFCYFSISLLLLLLLPFSA